MNTVFYIIRKGTAVGCSAQVVCAYATEAEAAEDIAYRDSSDPEASGLYTYVGIPNQNIVSCGNVVSIDKSVNQTTWQTLCPFHYAGSSQIRSPIVMRTYAYLQNANKSGTVRLFDVTNNKEIASIEYDGQIVSTYKFTTTFTNVPSGAATLEFQAKATNGNTFKIQSIELI